MYKITYVTISLCAKDNCKGRDAESLREKPTIGHVKVRIPNPVIKKRSRCDKRVYEIIVL